MQKLVNKIINESVKDADIYKTDGGSTWLIFTDNKQWVIELTESKTLWYNYNFFKNLFNYLSLDVVENQHYITKWVEDNIIGEVNDTHWGSTLNQLFVDDTIKNGVKETKYNQSYQEPKFKEVLRNDVRLSLNREYMPKTMVEDIIQNGVKETKACYYEDPKTGLMFVKWDFEIGNVIETGIKEVQPLPSQEGNKDWGIYYHGKEDRTKPHTEYVDEAIKTGIKYE